MYWKENIGIESIDREYKVFNFNPLKLSIEDGVKYLSSRIFCFNESVDKTIDNYIQLYFPKYLCSFFNPQSNLKKAELYFGIDDNGLVIGIPYIDNFNEDFINNLIDKIYLSNIKFPSIEIKNKIRQSIKVEVIPVNKSKIINNCSNKKSVYSRYFNDLEKIKNKNKLYKKKRNVWNEMCELNNPKLQDMINDFETRKFIWKYIKIKTCFMKKKFKNKFSHLEPYCDVNNYWNMMTNIKSNHLFDSLKVGSMVEINEDNLDIYKWVALWKDSKFSMLKKVKPIKPVKKINSYYPIFLLSQVSKMIPEWVQTNEKLNLFIIKITFNINDNQQYLQYKDITNQWKYSHRTMIDGIPMSPSFNSL